MARPADLEHLRQVLDSRGWAIIEQRLEEMLADELRQLERDWTEKQTSYIRGRIAMLRTVLLVPGIRMTELSTEP